MTGRPARHDDPQQSLLDDDTRLELPLDENLNPNDDERKPSAAAPAGSNIDLPRSLSGEVTRLPAQPHADRHLIDASVSSAVWSAWADGVGFISELTSIGGLMRRLQTKRPLPDGSAFEQLHRVLDDPPNAWPLRGTVEWKRRIGGRGGPTIPLPAGTYSDDTQLRLATSRCIENGRFDPEPFAFIELPTFSSYGLGGGHATKGGAAAMAKSSPQWSVPGHDGWANAGGNGVVMRVAPHAWAAAAYDTSVSDTMLDVIRNGVITHGHPRALLPACLHVYALVESLRSRELPPPSQLHYWIEELLRVPRDMADDPILGGQTIPALESGSQGAFERAWVETANEMHELIDRFALMPVGDGMTRGYLNACRDVGLFNKSTLGAGTSTFVAAYWLAWAFRDDPVNGLLLATNAVGTDTDTIATIAGAHLGTVRPFPLTEPVLDRDYIESETLRLVAPEHPAAAPAMRYPDLAHWQAPKAQADYVGIDPNSGRVAVAGLGGGEWVSRPVSGPNTPDFLWQWFVTDFGQSLLIKRRVDIRALPVSALPTVTPHGRPGVPTVGESDALNELRDRVARAEAVSKKQRKQQFPAGQPSSEDAETRRRRNEAVHSSPASPPAPGLPEQTAGTQVSEGLLERAIAYAEAHDFADEVVGRLARSLATESSMDEALVFFGFVAARWRRQRRG